MTPRFARWLVRLYPRYGDELEALLQDGPGGFRALVNVLCRALRERIGVTNRYKQSNMEQTGHRHSRVLLKERQGRRRKT
jgi:hypothetical protein